MIKETEIYIKIFLKLLIILIFSFSSLKAYVYTGSTIDNRHHEEAYINELTKVAKDVNDSKFTKEIQAFAFTKKANYKELAKKELFDITGKKKYFYSLTRRDNKIYCGAHSGKRMRKICIMNGISQKDCLDKFIKEVEDDRFCFPHYREIPSYNSLLLKYSIAYPEHKNTILKYFSGKLHINGWRERIVGLKHDIKDELSIKYNTEREIILDKIMKGVKIVPKKGYKELIKNDFKLKNKLLKEKNDCKVNNLNSFECIDYIITASTYSQTFDNYTETTILEKNGTYDYKAYLENKFPELKVEKFTEKNIEIKEFLFKVGSLFIIVFLVVSFIFILKFVGKTEYRKFYFFLIIIIPILFIIIYNNIGFSDINRAFNPSYYSSAHDNLSYKEKQDLIYKKLNDIAIKSGNKEFIREAKDFINYTMISDAAIYKILSKELSNTEVNYYFINDIEVKKILDAKVINVKKDKYQYKFNTEKLYLGEKIQFCYYDKNTPYFRYLIKKYPGSLKELKDAFEDDDYNCTYF